MYRNIKYFIIRPFLFLMVAFAFLKTLFLIVHAHNFSDKSLAHILLSYTKPIRLDIAAATYVIVIPVLMLFLQFLIKKRFIEKFNKWYFGLIIFVIALVFVIDTELYTHWQTKMNFKAFMFLNEPGQIAGAAGLQSIVQMLVYSIVSFFILWRLYLKFFLKKYVQSHFNFTGWLIGFVITVGLLILGIRGGWQQIPVNQSDAYYSDNPALNYAGVNSLWNLGNTIFQNKKYLNTNPYKKMGNEDAQTIAQSLFITEKDTTNLLLTNLKPNIIMVVLEGFNANVIKDFDSQVDYAPNLQQYIENGYSFTNMYGSGLRTDQGLVSIISGFPALPLNTIGAQPEKFQQLPSLSKTLVNAGYQCAFHFGGEPEFGSFKSFLVHNKFNPLVDFRDFPKNQLTQKLGAPDEFLFQKHLKDVDKLQEPFFSLIMTQTTHEPFDIPVNDKISDSKQKYLNTIQYTDSVLGWWMREIEKREFYENTLIIITSDHGHRFPGEYWYSDPKRFHIPFILTGPVLHENFKGKKSKQLAAQTDIPKTLLAQLQLPHEDFAWSKDLMNPYSPEFSFYIYINGFFWQTPEYKCGYEYHYNKVEFTSDSNTTAPCIREGQAYMQHLFETYLQY